ncbi:glycosyltransferase [Candidatus Gracilibacteria bacterium]|nr:MAG: glycosyltransferase [Candidatus Gracilibacteria bacterium]
MKKVKSETDRKYYFLINSLEVGGAERVVINQANELIKKGVQVYVFTLKSACGYELPKGVVHIPLCPIKNNFCLFLALPWFIYRFQSLRKKYGLDDGISFLEISNFIHILARREAKISFRTHINFFTGFFGWLQKLFIKILYPRAAKIIVNSRENRHDLAAYLGIPEQKIEVVYNTIDEEKIMSLSKEALEDKLQKKIRNKRVYITVGRLIKEKHHEIIMEGLSHLGNKDWVWLVVGDGPQRSFLEKKAQEYGLQDSIFFLGQQKNIFKYVAKSDFFLYASSVEGFPNVLLEARFLELPIITTDFKSGAREVILGEDTNMIGKVLRYPYKGKYGYLLDVNHYGVQFLEILKLMGK